jgi:hypothetical protein
MPRTIHDSYSSLEPICELPNDAKLDHPKEYSSNEVIEEPEMLWINEDGWLADEAIIQAELDQMI